MNKVFRMLVVIFVAITVLTSCQKEDSIDLEPGLVRSDNPPTAMFTSDIDYCQYQKVYVEKVDVEKAKYFGNYVSGYNVYYDAETGVRTQNSYSQDYYKITAKKYFGYYKAQTYISESNDFYIISAGDLNYVKELVSRKGSAIVYFGGENIDYRWKTISGAE